MDPRSFWLGRLDGLRYHLRLRTVGHRLKEIDGAPRDFVFRDPVDSGLPFLTGWAGVCEPFWEDVVLHSHPLSECLSSLLRHGVSLDEFAHDHVKYSGSLYPFCTKFPGDVYPAPIPERFADFVRE